MRHGRQFRKKSASNEGARYQNDICCRSIVPESPCDQSSLPFRVPRTSIVVILLLNVVFEIKDVLIAKTEQLIITKQKLFPSRKVKLEEKSTGNANEIASRKMI